MKARPDIDAVVEALLYEGYVLYPYRSSAVKNRHRFNFGGVYPPGWCERGEGDPDRLRVQCLVRGEQPRIGIELRFLHLLERTDGAGHGAWHEAMERRIPVWDRAVAPAVSDQRSFVLEARRWTEDGAERRCERVCGLVAVDVARVEAGTWRLNVVVRNTSPWRAASAEREEALLRAMASTHVLLEVDDGAFVSAIDPPDELSAIATSCRNDGLWPVLVGAPGAADAMLASPIILYDHPQIAPESPGDLFDGTEIDEILTLRVLTMTEDEKREARALDPRVRQLLDRSEALGPEALRSLHGALRPAPDRVAPVRPGTRVRIWPRRRADVFDLALRGRAATVATLERSVDGRSFVTVTMDDDPGRDLGLAGQPGHRFFFELDEVEEL